MSCKIRIKECAAGFSFNIWLSEADAFETLWLKLRLPLNKNKTALEVAKNILVPLKFEVARHIPKARRSYLRVMVVKALWMNAIASLF